jgi:hypothetical protein
VSVAVTFKEIAQNAKTLFFKFWHRHQSRLVQYKTENKERIGKQGMNVIGWVENLKKLASFVIYR